MASLFVQYGVPSRPGTGGIRGRVPVASTTPRRASNVRSPTATRRGPERRPVPRTSRPPLAARRPAAAWSFQSSVASPRIRPATLPQSGVTTASPARAGTRPASASRFPARIIILLGTHPQYGHSPPTSSASTPTTSSPASASVPATYSPPGPSPTTTTSACSFALMPASPRSSGSTDVGRSAEARSAGRRPVPDSARGLARKRTLGTGRRALCTGGHHRMRSRSMRPASGT